MEVSLVANWPGTRVWENMDLVPHEYLLFVVQTTNKSPLVVHDLLLTIAVIDVCDGENKAALT